MRKNWLTCRREKKWILSESRNRSDSTRLPDNVLLSWMSIWRISAGISWKAVSYVALLDESRTDLVRPDGLTKLFAEIRQKQTVQDLSPQYQKFAEWLRIEYVYA